MLGGEDFVLMQFIGNKISQKWQKVRTRGHNLGCVNMIAKSLKDDAIKVLHTRLLHPSMGFSRQEYWSGLPFLSPGGSSDPG